MVTHHGLCLISFATMNITIGSMIAISLTVLSHSRWFCLVAATEKWFGFTNLLATSQGSVSSYTDSLYGLLDSGKEKTTDIAQTIYHTT